MYTVWLYAFGASKWRAHARPHIDNTRLVAF